MGDASQEKELAALRQLVDSIDDPAFQVLREELDAERTARADLEERLAAERSQWQAVLGAMPFGVSIRDADCHAIYQNQVFIDTHARQREEQCRRAREGAEELCETCAVGRALEDGQYHTFLEEVILPSGELSWWQNTTGAVRDAAGRITATVELTINVTEQHKAEEALRRSEHRFYRIIQDQTEFIVRWKPGGVRTFVNEAYCKYYGLTPDEAIGRSFFELIHEEDLPGVRARLDRLSPADPVSTDEHRVLRPDGSIGWNHWIDRGIFDAEGTLVEGQSVGRDITERKRAQELLRQEKERAQKYLDIANVIFLVLDAHGRVALLNKKGEQLLGSGQNEALGKDWFKTFVAEADRRKARETFDLLLRADLQSVEYYEVSVLTGTGEQRLVAWHNTILTDADGRVTGTLSSGEDITDRRSMEIEREELLQRLALRNKELQSIVYTVSHDLKSPLINIQGFSGELEKACAKLVEHLEHAGLEPGAKSAVEPLLLVDIPECLYFITASTEKMRVLLDGILRVSRSGTVAVEKRVIDMNALVNSIVAAMQFEIQKHDASVTVEKLPPCYGDASLINQVFTNIIDNAVKYLDPQRKGVIHIGGAVEGKECVYRVADNGIGISPAHKAKIFEIFHRLDPTGVVSGEGLGLTIASRIVDRHHGRIWLESRPGEGTTFYVALAAP